MKLAIDLDGVALEYQKFFRELAWAFKTLGHQVGIITAEIDRKEVNLRILDDLGFPEFDFYFGRVNDEYVGEFKRRTVIKNSIDVLIDDFGENNPDIENTFFEKDLPNKVLIMKVIDLHKIKKLKEINYGTEL